MALKQINIRLDETLINRIKNTKNLSNKNFSDTVRDLLIFALESQESNSKNDQNFQSLFEKITLKTMETRAMTQVILNMVFNPEKSKFRSANEEAENISLYVKEKINELLSDHKS